MTGRGVVLIGYRGAGKSVVGEALAARLEVPFADTDAIVEEQLGRTIADLFATGPAGRAEFRRAESAAIAALDPGVARIVASGGGAVESEACRQGLAALGRVVWLRAEVATLRSRISGTDRPSLTGSASAGDEVAEVLSRREPLYQELAETVIDTDDRTPEEICDELQQLWRGPANHDLR